MKKVLSFLRPSPHTMFVATFTSLSDVGNSPLISQAFKSMSLPDFINGVFFTAISIGAILAVLRISYAGYLYMGAADMWGNKNKAKEILSNAIIGLLLLLATWLILHTINPDILSLNITQQQAATVPAQQQQQQKTTNTATQTYDASKYVGGAKYAVGQSCTQAYGSAYVQVEANACTTQQGLGQGSCCSLPKSGSQLYAGTSDIPNGQWCYKTSDTGGGFEYACSASQDQCKAYAGYAGNAACSQYTETAADQTSANQTSGTWVVNPTNGKTPSGWCYSVIPDSGAYTCANTQSDCSADLTRHGIAGAGASIICQHY